MADGDSAEQLAAAPDGEADPQPQEGNEEAAPPAEASHPAAETEGVPVEMREAGEDDVPVDEDGETHEGEDEGESRAEGEDSEYMEGDEDEDEEQESGEEGEDGESGTQETIRQRLRREGRERARSMHPGAPASECSLAEVAAVEVSSPVVSDIHILPRDDYPQSYSSHTPKEARLAKHTDRFVAQYMHLYPDRKPLFLCPLNDCRIPKCASTFIRPTVLPHIACYDWQGCARFVADHVQYRPLSRPTEVPPGMMAPTTVLQYQSANCFEASTLLCSLLAGAGYRAYVVSGYAVRAVCLQETTRVACPDMVTHEEAADAEQQQAENPYQLKPPKELVSRYEALLVERVLEAERAAKREQLEREIAEVNELEREPPDPLFGMRVHAWVLVLPGERDVTEPFFIEPSTGVGKCIQSPDYLGIESLWNHRNYWINLQYCINGVRDLEYDLFNPAHWEYLLLRDALCTRHPAEADTDFEESVIEGDRLMEMPFSWVERLRVTKERYDERFPCGRKVTHFYRSKVEEYAPYSMKDGLVKRLTIYSDFHCTAVVSVKEQYRHRADKLESRETTSETSWVVERYGRGREDAIQEHQYGVLGHNPEDRRVVQYWSKARKDCLLKRTVREGGIIEEDFEEREDKLYRRVTQLGVIQKKFGPAGATRKPIVTIREWLHRQPRGDGDDGISQRTFDIAESKISMVFHACRGRITAERREFTKPHPDDKARLVPILEEAAESGFSAGPLDEQPRMLDLYYMMKGQMDVEERTVAAVREAEDEIVDLLNARMQEEAALDIEWHLFDSDRQPQIRADRAELEAFQAEQATRLVEKDKDPLSPFLARLNMPEPELSVPERFTLRQDCMQAFRQRLVDKANRLQKQFEEETEALQSRQRWYQQNYVGLTEDEEQQYLAFCHDTMFRLHVLELLLERHKQMAPLKHQALETRLRADPRIAGRPKQEEHQEDE